MRRPGPDAPWVAVLVLAAVITRGLFAGLAGLTHDEPFTLYWAHRPLSELFAQLWHENNPPLHFLLVKALLPLTGTDEALLRMPGVIASGLTLWPLFLIGRELAGRRAGAVAALLMLFSVQQQGFAHEVRAYALLQLLAVTAVWQVVRLARKGAGRGPLALLVLADVAMVYTHFFGWLAIGVQMLLVMALPALRQARGTVLVAAAITMLAQAPYGAILLERLTTSVGQGTWLASPPPEELYNMLWRWSNAPVLVVLFLAAALVAGLRPTGRGPLWWTGLLWGVVPLVGLFLVSLAVPVFLDRYLLFAAPGWCLLVAQGLLCSWPSRRMGLLLAGVGVGGMAFTFDPARSPIGEPQQVVAVARAMGRDRAPVLVMPSWYAYAYAWHVDPALFGHRGSWPDALAAHGIVVVDDPLRPPDAALKADTLLLVDAGSALVDPGRALERALAQRLGAPDVVEADRGVRVLRFRQ